MSNLDKDVIRTASVMQPIQQEVNHTYVNAKSTVQQNSKKKTQRLKMTIQHYQ